MGQACKRVNIPYWKINIPVENRCSLTGNLNVRRKDYLYSLAYARWSLVDDERTRKEK
jgi:hypothetical protein